MEDRMKFSIWYEEMSEAAKLIIVTILCVGTIAGVGLLAYHLAERSVGPSHDAIEVVCPANIVYVGRLDCTSCAASEIPLSCLCAVGNEPDLLRGCTFHCDKPLKKEFYAPNIGALPLITTPNVAVEKNNVQ